MPKLSCVARLVVRSLLLLRLAACSSEASQDGRSGALQSEPGMSAQGGAAGSPASGSGPDAGGAAGGGVGGVPTLGGGAGAASGDTASGGGGAPATTRLVHPGILNSSAEVASIKAHVEAKHEPWLSAFTSLEKSSYGSLAYRARPLAVVECGSYNVPNVGCNEIVDDGMAAYAHALLWSGP